MTFVQNYLAALRLLVIGLLATAPRSWAQNVFVANEDGRFWPVKEIRFGHPRIEVEGKITACHSQLFALVKTPAYRPGFVVLPRFTLLTHHLNVGRAGARLNYELRIHGVAKSDVARQNCFFVLEFTAGRGTSFTYAEMPDLEAGKEEDFSVAIPIAEPVEEGRYTLHLFSDGAELLHSRMPPAYVEAQQQKAAGFWSGQTQDFPAVPARRVPAVYPAELASQSVEGRVEVRCRINAQGGVESAEVVECSQPAFAEPALAAVRQWKFDPAVKERRLVDSTEIVTIQIKPPDQGKSKP